MVCGKIVASREEARETFSNIGAMCGYCRQGAKENKGKPHSENNFSSSRI
jgi:hypothetical protein